MEVIIQSTHGDLNFKGTNERGQSIQLSGNKEAVSPMEAVLMAAAGCSSIDVELFLKKMRQDIKSILVKVTGERVDAVPAVFSSIHMHYILTGDIKEAKAKQAIEMSIEKYCSVSIMLGATVKISHSFEIT
ncbi:MAG: OsmC family protein [Saprospiraceae bacterium]|nr:OsmC family protein [Saprospiraceae bacterium]